MRIAIAGPGRSGTSVLVRLLGAWGFRVPDGPWHDDAAAGLEARLGSRPDLEVEKDPWAFEYVHRLDPSVIASYDAVIVPIRRRRDASMSRSVRDRLNRAIATSGDEWKWDSWGIHAGGVVAETTADAVANTLGKGLWDLLDVVSSAGVTPIIVNFPRFAIDFDYLWSVLGPLVSDRVTRAAAEQAWREIVDPSLIRMSAPVSDDARIAELEALVEQLREVARRETGARHAAEALLGSTADATETLTREREEAERAHRVAAELHREVDRLHAEIRARDEHIATLQAGRSGASG